MERAAVALVTLAVAILALAGRADAFVYWTNSAGGTDESGSIGRANLDGTGVNQGFIGATDPHGMAVDGAHVYWAGASVIGRANLDGTGVNQSFIGTGFGGISPGAFNPQQMAVDSHVYWADSFRDQNNRLVGVIARANLDGTGVNDSFIVVNDAASNGVAVDGAYVYWTGANVIGRANLDGTGVDQSFITGANEPWGVAVDGAHIYWVNAGNGTIGRANLDGTDVDQSFITGDPATEPEGIAVDGAHIYWANSQGGTGGAGTIGRANLDGTGVDQSFITGVSSPLGVAVDALTPSGACLGRRATITATGGGPTRGTPGNDVIVGSRGTDRISSGGGSDLVCSRAGDDRVSTGAGADRVSAGPGEDWVRTGGGADSVNPGSGRDRITTGPGNDWAGLAGTARDRLDCGAGDDRALRDRADRLRRCERVRRG